MDLNSPKKPTDAEDILSEFDSESDTPGSEEAQEPEFKPVAEPEPSTESVPDSTEPVPDSTEPVPDSTEPVPDSTEPVPDSTEPVPDSTEPVPDSTEPKLSEPRFEEDTSESNSVFIGSKHLAVYVAETLNRLSASNTVTLKARGKKITQAVNVSQMLLKRMDSAGCVISDVRISSEMLLSDDGKQSRVSLMEIDISKD